MKRRIILALLVLCMLFALFPATVMGMLPPYINSISVDPVRVAAGAEVRLQVWNSEPEGTKWRDARFTINDPGTTCATVTLDGNFLATAPGTAVVTVEVYDEILMGPFTQNVQITVYEQINITTQSLPDGQIGVPYFASLEATGSPIYWDWDSVALPPGLDLYDWCETATIEGTPTEIGTYQIDIEASNNYADARAHFTLQIAETNENNMIQQPPAWTQGSDESASFTSDADFTGFLQVRVDGNIVDESNYIVNEGSTIITFTPGFLQTLSVGMHQVEIVSVSGIAYGTLEIKSPAAPAAEPVESKPKSTVPKTGDNTLIYTLPLLILLSAGTIFLLIRKRRASQKSD
jgi:LPXTG-motif cell wall-anchored protein